ncbi:DUF3307 domain-containing protein [Actinoplanes sp. NPDC051494]|uniref:DUF3307 domain-containing protein n=1 Tax=Actinoplanes sp. NPDC051494 TaxID=3363907 RepID=UPI0037A7654A
MNIGTIFAALYAAHQVADHHVQTDCQARDKGKPGRDGQLACLRHVASYTATAVVALAATAAVTGARPQLGRVAAGLALSAVTHYVIDRRKPLRRFAELTGHAGFYQLGAPRPEHDDNPSLGTGAYALDQSAHVGFLFAAALIIGGGRTR